VAGALVRDLLETSASEVAGVGAAEVAGVGIAGKLTGPGCRGRARDRSDGGLIEGPIPIRGRTCCTASTGVIAAAAAAPCVIVPVAPTGGLSSSVASRGGRFVGTDGLPDSALLPIEPTTMAAPATANPSSTE